MDIIPSIGEYNAISDKSEKYSRNRSDTDIIWEDRSTAFLENEENSPGSASINTLE